MLWTINVHIIVIGLIIIIGLGCQDFNVTISEVLTLRIISVPLGRGGCWYDCLPTKALVKSGCNSIYDG